MGRWRPQRYQNVGEQRGVARDVLNGALRVAQETLAVDPRLPPVFTLRHLAYLTNTDYGLLRAIVSREAEDPYTVYRIRKTATSSGTEYRIICVPSPALMRLQRWIARRILS